MNSEDRSILQVKENDADPIAVSKYEKAKRRFPILCIAAFFLFLFFIPADPWIGALSVALILGYGISDKIYWKSIIDNNGKADWRIPFAFELILQITGTFLFAGIIYKKYGLEAAAILIPILLVIWGILSFFRIRKIRQSSDNDQNSDNEDN